MCGLAGFISYKKIFSENDLTSMTSCIRHRGPDSEGFFFNGTVGLGHRRLSILDLSEAADQPMYSANGRYVMVYNGEVYNFKEIASELNRPFKTSSDTEVILEAFDLWGLDFVHKLNGMFAIAIYDLQLDELYVFRDRMGIKPVYYYSDGESVAFASELKSLVNIKPIKNILTLDKEAIDLFLYLGYIPKPFSIYNQIKKLDSGSFLKVGKSGVSISYYWKLEDQIESETISDFNKAKGQLKELILSSVGYRLISDVPFGTFLSGGVDSSVVTAAAQHISDQPVNTFSIGFNESKFNESQYARAVAKQLGTNHHEFTVTYKEAIELAEKIPEIYDEPFADSSAIPTLLVSELARKHVTMTLSGDGGDELFFGYGMYHWAHRLDNPLIKAFRKPAGWMLSHMGNKFERASYLFRYPHNAKVKSHIFSQEQYCFTNNEIDNLVEVKYQATPALKETFDIPARKLTTIESQAFFDLNYYLQDDLLVKVDRATMKHSLETRVPLLDYRIIKFALNLDPSLKQKNGVDKYLLKEVLYDFVPKELFDRPKQGFGIPLVNWLRTELRYLIDDYLNEKVIKEFNIVKYNQVTDLIKSFLSGKDFLYNRIWLLIVLHRWLVLNKNNFNS